MDALTFAIYKLTLLPALVCATISSTSRTSRRVTFGSARPLPSGSHMSSRTPSILRLATRLTTILNGTKDGSSNVTKSFSSPKVQACSRVSTRASRGVVKAGSLLILFPRVWHRYAPDPGVGWTEHWIECQGPIFDEAVRTGIVRPHPADIAHRSWNPTFCGASSAVTHSPREGHWRINTFSQPWERTCSRSSATCKALRDSTGVSTS